MRLSRAGSNSRHFPRFEPHPVPSCPCHGLMELAGTVRKYWKCKLCPRVAALEGSVPIAENNFDRQRLWKTSNQLRTVD